VLLLAMGYDVLSMNATSLPRVKRAMRALPRPMRGLLAEVLPLDSGEQMQQRVESFSCERGLQQLVPAPVD
jgi:phosphotransferase system enzyme I (PtsP)